MIGILFCDVLTVYTLTLISGIKCGQVDTHKEEKRGLEQMRDQSVSTCAVCP